jgi:5-methylcytosine-specific restriction enzyme subunit McrC
MLARDSPGILFYPDCQGDNETQSQVADQYTLTVAELPTAVDVGSYEEFIQNLEQNVQSLLQSILASI